MLPPQGPARERWRLKKTLQRNPSFRPLEKEDFKYIWAAYKKGALEQMGFADTSLSAGEFEKTFEIEITTKYHGAWTLFAPTRKGRIPVGMALGFWPHAEAAFAAYMTVGGIAFFPWASARNRIESACSFFNRIRNEIPMQGYALMGHKKMYEIMCQHGIMRRIGTSLTAIPGHSAAMFETRVTQ